MSTSAPAAPGRLGELRIRTPEGISFALPLAGPMARLLAWMVDACCIAAAAMVGGQVAGRALAAFSTELGSAFNLLLYFVLSIGYAMVLEWLWRGQTVGKRLFHLRVVDERGLRLHPSQVVVRNLLRPIDSLPLFYLVGGIAALLSRRAQRLGDYAANTVVVRVPPVDAPDLDELLSSQFNSLRAHPHLAARLRQRVTPAEARLALLALVRRGELDAAARVELFRALAEHFRALVAFPDEATDTLGDEPYVRNVVDICLRARA